VFTRLGRWNDAIKVNVRALTSLRRAGAGGGIWSAYVHAADWLMYAYLQTGWDERAAALQRQVARVARFEQNFEAAYALAALHARPPLEHRDWEQAARVGAAGQADFPWDDYPAARAVTWFARGIGAARSGDPIRARAAADALALLAAKLATGDPYWGRRVEAQRLAVEAWISLADGASPDVALEQMRAAADLEDSLEIARLEPETVLPLRELLGEMLRHLDRNAEALREFEISLSMRPGRFLPTYAAGRAAQNDDNTSAARVHYEQLLRLVEGSRAKREEIEIAKTFLRKNPAPDREQ
jgi:hypothetical protein